MELCRYAGDNNWLCGLLRAQLDIEQIEALADTPTPRLVVVDYAETRADQLQLSLPDLVAAGTIEHPMRVLLLIRAAPSGSTDWAAPLRRRGGLLDGVLDEADVLDLQAAEWNPGERQRLFAAALSAFAARLANEEPGTSGESSAAVFQSARSPLLVLAAAYLAAAGSEHIPSNRADLLAGLADHEDRYLANTYVGSGLDYTLRQRIIGLASLAGADSEDEARELLALLPDLAGASNERKGQLARWVSGLYPGPRFWNPVEPDLLGEHMTTTEFVGRPGDYRWCARPHSGDERDSPARRLCPHRAR